jgi:Secretion system C-terminal sorting domain
MANNTKFLAFGGGNNAYAGTKLTAITVAADTVFKLFGRDSLNSTAAYVTNANGTGDVSFKKNTNGTFTAFYLSTNNGIAAATSRVFTSVGDLKAARNFEVQILGNPFRQELNLKIKAGKAAKTNVSLLNSLGENVASKQVALQSGDNNVLFSTGHLPAGMYVVSVTDGEGRQALTVVKQ